MPGTTDSTIIDLVLAMPAAVWFAFLVVLAVLWVILPIVVYEAKRRLDRIDAHVQSIERNPALGQLAHDIEQHLAAIADSVERIEGRIDPDGTQLARYRKGLADKAAKEELRADAQARAEIIEARIAAEEARRQERFATLRAEISALNKSVLSTFGDTYSPKSRAARQKCEAQIRACQKEMRLLETSTQVSCPDCAEVFEVLGIAQQTKHTCPKCGMTLEVE